MSLIDDLRKKLKPEDVQTIEDILGDDFDWDLVPRSRLNKVVKQRNELKKQLEGTSQEPSNKPSGTSQVDDDDDKLTYTAEEVQKLLQAERTKQSDAAKSAEIKYATLLKLQEANALDANLVFGLLDASKLSLDSKGELQGLEDAGLKTIKESKAFLFKSEQEDVPPGTGRQQGGSGGKGNPDALDAAIANVFAGYGVAQNSEE